MKKLYTILIVLIFTFSQAGCTQNDAQKPQMSEAAANEISETVSAAVSEIAGSTEKPPQEEAVIVYRTKTGECWHRDGCPCLKSRIETTLEEARAMGLRPCGVCNPPS